MQIFCTIICASRFFVVTLQRQKKTNTIMANKKIKANLREILNARAADLTPEQKNEIREYANQFGVPTDNLQTNCGSCYHDLALKVYNAIVEQEGEKVKDEKKRYVLKPDVDLFFGDIRVNAATMTDDLAERIIARGFEKKYFAKCG